MIKMDQYEYVRTAHRVYGKTIKEIARDTGHSRNTVKKVLKREPFKYKERSNQAYPALGEYLGIIDGWLIKDKEFPKKQRHTARRIYNRLKNEYGYTGSESGVRRYVRAAKLRLGVVDNKAFIPLNPRVGREAEIDWGSAMAIISGEKQRLKYFCIRSKYSGKHFLRFYECERQQAFFDAHLHAFMFFGGIFPVLIYDNLKTAVYKVFRGRERIEQEAFISFKGYHNFESRFCNSGQGHEKGGVEGMVGFVRRNYMVPVPEAISVPALNESMLKECISYGNHKLDGRTKTVNELFEEEKEYLLSLPPHPYGNMKTENGKVDKYSTVVIDRNRYSVPVEYAGYKVKTVLYVDRVDIFYGNKKIGSHKRLYSCGKWGLNPDHYLDLLAKRPLAFESARPIQELRKSWPDCYERLLEHFRKKQGDAKGTKDFINVLIYHREYDREAVKKAVELTLTAGISDSAGVGHILSTQTGRSDKQANSLAGWMKVPPPDISLYSQLGGAV